MRFTAFVLLVATGASAAVFGGSAPGAAPVPKHLMKGEESDFKALQGEWALAQVTLGGQALPANTIGNADLIVTFRGNAVVVTSEKQNQRTTATLTLDPKANPPQFTWSAGTVTNLKGEPVKNEHAEKPCAMLYKLEADTLVLAASIGDQTQAPKGFGGTDNPDVATMTFTRVKK